MSDTSLLPPGPAAPLWPGSPPVSPLCHGSGPWRGAGGNRPFSPVPSPRTCLTLQIRASLHTGSQGGGRCGGIERLLLQCGAIRLENKPPCSHHHSMITYYTQVLLNFFLWKCKVQAKSEGSSAIQKSSGLEFLLVNNIPLLIKAHIHRITEWFRLEGTLKIT